MKNINLFQAACLSGLVAIALPSCGPSAGHASAGDDGQIIQHPDGSFFAIEANQSGEATNMQVLSVTSGRLIDFVYDDTAILPVHKNLVVNPSLMNRIPDPINPGQFIDHPDFLFETDPITRITSLSIAHTFGTPAFDSAFADLMDGMDSALLKSLDPSVLPPYTMIPRNSAIVITFSDLIDASSINSETLRIGTGYTPSAPFAARIFPDPNFGAQLDGTFYTTRVIVDPVVTVFEADATGLPVNSVGLPASLNTGSPNLAIRIPTVKDFSTGQFTLLSNLSGHPLQGAGSAPFDYGTTTVDVIRALRSGGLTDKVGDANNGFLGDDDLPQLIGRQGISITSVTVDGAPSANTFLVDYTYTNLSCAQTPRVGDVITQPDVFAEVIELGPAPVGANLSAVKIKLVSAGSSSPFVAAASFDTPWSTEVGASPASCFVTFDPPAGTGTTGDVDPAASVILHFSEPMDPELIRPFDSFVISSTNQALENFDVSELTVGEITATPDMRDFRFIPTTPLRHTNGVSETFFLNLFGSEGIVDLAGNALAEEFETVSFTLDNTAVTQLTSGFSFRFANYTDHTVFGNVVDENGDGQPDIRGQFVANALLGTISPRPVDRFSQTIDRNQFVPGWMTPMSNTATGGLLGTVQEPLNPLGCKLMSLWRYFDMGLDVVDEAFVNIDVEHVNWAPIGSSVNAEYFPQFQISMATAMPLPDESYITPPNTLVFPNSGLDTNLFANNVLPDPLNTMKVMHDKQDGYFIDPIQKFQTSGNTFLFPYPLNKNKPLEDYRYWTYRDTAIEARGGNNPNITLEPPVRFDTDGVNFIGSSEFTVTVADPDDPTIIPNGPGLFAPDGFNIPSFGLPILMEYRCYASDKTVGLNRLDTSLAMAPAWATGVTPQNALASLPRQPFFRMFSAGGVDSGELELYKDPDLEVLPTGGFHYEATTIAIKGSQTSPADNIYYMGQLDFVVRVSRVHTIWHQVPDANPLYFEPVLEPRNDQQPQGTSVQVHLRGATQNNNAASLGNAMALNMYGDAPAGGGPSPGFGTMMFGDPAQDNAGIVGASVWNADTADMTGFRFFQVRMTFINNPAAGTFPELSTLAIANAGQ